MESDHMVVMDGTNFPEFRSHEEAYIAHLSSNEKPSQLPNGASTIAEKIEKARAQIKSSLDNAQRSRAVDLSRLEELEKTVKELIDRMSVIESQLSVLKNDSTLTESKETHKKKESEDADEVNLFGSDDEDGENWEKIKAERQAGASIKPKEIAKSAIVFDVKPWSDEIDLKEMEEMIREIKTDGLVWGQSKLIPVAYGIKKLQICCVVEDDKVGTDFIEEAIMEFEDHVQSVDIVSFNKI